MTVTPANALREQLHAFAFQEAFLARGWNAPARQPFTLDARGRQVTCLPIAEQGGWTVLEVTVAPVAEPPGITDVSARALREAIDAAVTNLIHHHVLVFVNNDRTEAVWQFSAAVGGKRLRRERRYNPTTPVEPLVALLRGMEIPFEMLDEEGEVSVTAMNDRMAQTGLFADRVSKKFYDVLAKKRKDFDKFLAWLDEEKDRNWYVTALLNRLMFIYFIQHKGLMKGDTAYLRHRLDDCIEHGFNFYRDFFLPLCFFGFAKPWGERQRYGGHFDGIPYLNGGLFLPHPVELGHGITPEAVEAGTLPAAVTIPNEEFARWLDFFDAYRWTLDEERVENDREINPDILGYIFEKYINQKQMGAYYTKEDITGYICRNTIIPRLFDMLAATGKKGARAVKPLPIGPHPNLLNDGLGISGGEGIERYIYPAVKTQERLPTETDREYLARQQRYDAILRDFEDGKITAINDFITYNLDIERLALDFIAGVQDAEVLRDFYFSGLRKITVLDPTCGSGAFLFAALKVLYPLYAACVKKMEAFHAREAGGAAIAVTWKGEFAFANEVSRQLGFIDTPDDGRQAILDLFGAELTSIRDHDNVEYFIYKRIIVDNLFGVDIMAEAVEICKLRLFLKLIAHADYLPGKEEDNYGIEPLPDVDFNILCGNTLVGFATHDEVRKSILGLGGNVSLTMQYGDDTMDRIEEKARAVDTLATAFRQAQTARNIHAAPEQKAALEKALRDLEYELNGYLAKQYSITSQESKAYATWLESHQPFHWYVEFYGTMKRGGFDAIIGNPPYLEVREVDYVITGYACKDSGAIHAMCMERSARLLHLKGCMSMIVPLSLPSTQRMQVVQALLEINRNTWYSNFAWRPAKLFDTVNRALTIFVVTPSSSPRTFSTNYQKWTSDNREGLFERMSYVEVLHERPACWVPKLGDLVEQGMLQKCLSVKTSVKHFIAKSEHRIYYRTTGGLYWKVFTDFAPAFSLNGIRGHSSRETWFTLARKENIRPVIAALSSNLFWWWYTITSNLRDLNPFDIQNFPLPESALANKELHELGQRYLYDIAENSTMLVRQQKQTGTTETQSFKIQKSKPIIDEIDRVLARHYGFTDEELDFIINYDIKYRMGRDAEGDDE